VPNFKNEVLTLALTGFRASLFRGTVPNL